MVIGTDCTGSCKFNYHTITTMTVPNNVDSGNAVIKGEFSYSTACGSWTTWSIDHFHIPNLILKSNVLYELFPLLWVKYYLFTNNTTANGHKVTMPHMIQWVRWAKQFFSIWLILIYFIYYHGLLRTSKRSTSFSFILHLLPGKSKKKQNTENIISQSVYPIMDEQLKLFQ